MTCSSPASASRAATASAPCARQARVDDQILYLPGPAKEMLGRIRGSEAVPHPLRVRHGSRAPHDAVRARAAAPASAPPPRARSRADPPAPGAGASRGRTGSSEVGSSSSTAPARQRHPHPRVGPRGAAVHHQQAVHHPHPLPERRRLRGEAQRVRQAPSRLSRSRLAPVRRPRPLLREGRVHPLRQGASRGGLPRRHPRQPRGHRPGRREGERSPRAPSTGTPSAKSSGGGRSCSPGAAGREARVAHLQHLEPPARVVPSLEGRAQHRALHLAPPHGGDTVGPSRPVSSSRAVTHPRPGRPPPQPQRLGHRVRALHPARAHPPPASLPVSAPPPAPPACAGGARHR